MLDSKHHSRLPVIRRLAPAGKLGLLGALPPVYPIVYTPGVLVRIVAWLWRPGKIAGRMLNGSFAAHLLCAVVPLGQETE